MNQTTLQYQQYSCLPSAEWRGKWLTLTGPQTLSLLMVPISSPRLGIPNLEGYTEMSDDDFYLYLHLPPELELPLVATAHIYRQAANSYLIPRWDLGPDSGAFIRFQFPAIGNELDMVTQEDVDTFETILAQCTAFLERTAPPEGHAAYNLADYTRGEDYISSAFKQGESHGKVVLVDEDDGTVVGELTEYDIVEKPEVKPGSKHPVLIQLPAEGEGNQISVSNISDEYLRMAQHPAYRNSTIVQTSAIASRLLVTGSSFLANILTSGADTFAKKTKPNPKPMTFSQDTHAHIRKISSLSRNAADFSAKTIGQVSKYAQNFGASLARRKDNDGLGSQGGNTVDYKPGILNRSIIAFSTLAAGIEQSARTVLSSGSAATSAIIGHRYGAEAGAVAAGLTGGVTNVGLVYIDATGVSRKAFLMSVAKGMIVGRTRDGKHVVVVGGSDGGQVTPGMTGGLGSSQSSAAHGTGASVARRASPSTSPPAHDVRSLG
ncbi:senescence-associated protein-domain-containing protein [Lipomyces chichibuensis]|uniref:senescence-associated protein-domain-containing protein n=1 Tax=Lipomyces chichibuensis TaxID=1546026 RepID=UPI0033435581